MKATKKGLFLIITILALIAMAFFTFAAIPSKPSITYISNDTSSSFGIGAPRAGDPGGYIITLTLNTTQQNTRFKAYVGNVTGSLVLEDSGGYSIYDWPLSLNALGNVFISRNGTVDWVNNISCANQTIKESEDTFLNINSGQSNSINKTFYNKTHKVFDANSKSFTNRTCFSIATYLNDTSQTLNESALFQEVLLVDNNDNLVYMTILEQNQAGFDNNQYDFQAIIAEDETAGSPTTYYFYVELLQ